MGENTNKDWAYYGIDDPDEFEFCSKNNCPLASMCLRQAFMFNMSEHYERNGKYEKSTDSCARFIERNYPEYIAHKEAQNENWSRLTPDYRKQLRKDYQRKQRIKDDKISGKGTWEKNPLVFAYEFERID